MNNNAIDGILFDKDGTLLDYHLSWGPLNRHAAAFAARGDEQLAARILQANGFDPSTGRVMAGSVLAAGTTSEIADGFIAAGCSHPRDELITQIDAIFRAGVGSVVPVTDLNAFFHRLAGRGLKLGVASSDSEAAIRLTGQRFTFIDTLDFIAGWDSGYPAKPAPAMLQAFARQCRIPAARLAVVGDNSHDMEMAAAGGCGLRVGVLTGTSSRAELAPLCDLCLDSIRDLEQALFD